MQASANNAWKSVTIVSRERHALLAQKPTHWPGRSLIRLTQAAAVSRRIPVVRRAKDIHKWLGSPMASTKVKCKLKCRKMEQCSGRILQNAHNACYRGLANVAGKSLFTHIYAVRPDFVGQGNECCCLRQPVGDCNWPELNWVWVPDSYGAIMMERC